tara:strand:- start:69 stop:632 length:564 start_codon:yes stop_codon:yes gene_type:complete
MGTLFVDNLKHQSAQGSGTITIGASGEKVDLGAGVSGGSLTNTPAFFAYQTAHGGTSLTANTATKVILDTKLYDTDNAYSTSTGLFTVPSGKAGKYFAIANITVKDNLTNLQPYLFRNDGTESSQHIYRGVSIYQNAGSAASVSGTFNLDVGDTLSTYVIQAHNQEIEGVILSRTATYFQAFKLIGV